MLKKTKYVHEQYLGDQLLLLNLLTFNFVILDHEDARNWEGNHLTLLHNIVKLQKEHFLVEDDSALLSFALQTLRKKRSLPPEHVIFITDECNQKCPYCFEKESGSLRNIKRALLPEDIDNIFSTIIKITGSPDRAKIVLFGGEPLLTKNMSLIQYCLSQAKHLGLPPLNIVTNGTTLHQYIGLLTEYSSQIDSVIVTLNGNRSLHEIIRGTTKSPTFDIIINNIKLILDKTPDIEIQINLLLEKRNITNIDNLLETLSREGILGNSQVSLLFGRIQSRTQPLQQNYSYALPYELYYSEIFKQAFHSPYIDDDMITGSELDILSQIYKHWKTGRIVLPHLRGCQAVYPGRFCYYVDGNIYPCTEIVGKSSYVIGNYYAGTIDDRAFAKWKGFNIENIKKCMECKYIGLCTGGCPVTNIEMNAAIDAVYCLHVGESLSNMISTLYKEGFFDEYFKV